MEKEVVKSFFEGTRRAGLRVQALWEKLEEVQQAAYSVHSATIHERVQGGRRHELADEVERLEAARLAYLTAFIVFCDRECKALDLLQLDTDHARKAIMIERFISRKPWKQIGKDAGLSTGHVMRLVRESCAEIGDHKEAVGILESQ